MSRAPRRTLGTTDTTESAKPPKRLDSELHHCSQCNRPTSHEVFEHPDGVVMKCPCGYSFVDVRESTKMKNDADESEL